MFSIDQNCHSLWDALPKLHALAAAGHRVTHFLEDVDVAFTAMGSSVDDSVLHFARERFHRSGGQDWGAALFYSKFLGKLPVEIRDWEPYTALKTSTLARKLERTVDELYDAYSPSDNWQLIGSSYIGDRDHHRVIGDLSVRETRDFVLDLVKLAKDDMLGAFPQRDSQERLRAWFAAEEALLGRLLAEWAGAGLIDLYRAWMSHHLGRADVRLALSSSLFAPDADPARSALLDAFVAHYERAAGLYNQALADTGSDLRPLATADGELPFFAVQEFQGHLVRTAAALRGGQVHFGRQSFALDGGHLPVEAMARAGIRALAGKAVLLVVQARVGPSGQALALPHHGSAYMPTAHRLAARLAEAGLLAGELRPVVRVRFHLLDRLRELDTVVRLPEHLAGSFGRREVAARELGEGWAAVAAAAAQRLATLRDPSSRAQWARDNFPELAGRIDALDGRRRQLAQGDTTPEQMRELWDQEKALRHELLERTVAQIARDWQLSQLDYWDSRGALLPWSLALGGQPFYDRLIAQAEIYEEPTPA